MKNERLENVTERSMVRTGKLFILREFCEAVMDDMTVKKMKIFCTE